MAHRLNMSVVAEGVEIPAQLEFLMANDCDYGQGYLFGRAVPLRELRPLLGPLSGPLLGPKGPMAAGARSAQSTNARLNQGT